MRYYNQTRSIARLGLTHHAFKKLGLTPTKIAPNDFNPGYRTVYLYDADIIDALVDEPKVTAMRSRPPWTPSPPAPIEFSTEPATEPNPEDLF